MTAVQSDVGKLEDLDLLYTVVKEQKGRLDIVFANAYAVRTATNAHDKFRSHS